jgi:nucleoside-diphosphate-sugar epimerase
MRVLVTGHDGYIGSVLMPLLRAAGHETVGLDTFFFDDCNLRFGATPYRVIRKDLRDVVAADLDGIEAVCHLAALSNDPLGDLSPRWTHDINHRGALRLARLARENGAQRFLLSSSCSLYGANTNGDLLTEDAPPCPLTTYALSKVRLEADLANLADDHFSPVFLRNSTAYGVSPRVRLDLVLNNLVAWAFTTGRVKITSDGTPWRPIVHIEDIGRVFVAMLDAPRDVIHAQAFNIGVNAENYQVRQIAEIVQRIVPRCEIEYVGKGGPDPRDYRVDFTKLWRTFPDLQFRWTALRGAQELYDAFRGMSLTVDELEGRRFIRVNHLRHLVETGRLDNSLRWTEPPPP